MPEGDGDRDRPTSRRTGVDNEGNEIMLHMTLRTLLATLALFGSVATASAQDAATWPTKSVRIIVPFGAGGPADNLARVLGEHLTKALGQPFVIENRGGASGALGLETLKRAAPDGYTFGLTPSFSLAILPHLRPVPYDPFKDFVAVAAPAYGTLVLAVHPSLPVKSVQELIEYARKNPDKLNWGSAGVGSFGHIVSEYVKQVANLNILHVPYRGSSDSVRDFLAGVHQINGDPTLLPHAAKGTARLLAVIDRARHPDFPDVPVLKEIMPELDFVLWFGILAPAGTPEPIARKLEAALAKIAGDKSLEPGLRKIALSLHPGSGKELTEFIKRDYARFGDLIKKRDIKAK